MSKAFNRPVNVRERQVAWAQFVSKAAAEERPYIKTALDLFTDEAVSIRNLFREPTKNDAFIVEALTRIMTNYRPGGSYHREWLNRFLKLITKTMFKAANGLSADIGLDFTLVNNDVIQAALSRAEELATLVGKTTADKISAIVSEGRRDGLGMGEIADRINDDVFGSQVKERSILIARTETIGAYNQGETVSAKSNKMQFKEWLSQGDTDVRDSHDSLDGVRIPIDETFSNGCRFPGDKRGGPDEICNCRCTLTYHRSIED